MNHRLAFAALLPLIASCATTQNGTQGPLQPQSVAGPCQVKPFFLLSLRSIPAEMTVANTGQACTLTLINPALNAVVDAALVNVPARHGDARSGLTPGSRQAVLSYTPAPGYAGPDEFRVTLEPGAVGITMRVTVTPKS